MIISNLLKYNFFFKNIKKNREKNTPGFILNKDIFSFNHLKLKFFFFFFLTF
jgi:hypothetical protein